MRVGPGGEISLPPGRVVGFGLAGALVPGLPAGSLVTAWRIVDEDGETLWEGRPLSVAGAIPVVLCATDRVIDDPAERSALADRTGARAVDMESRALAARGGLAGVIRAISDTPDRPVGRLASAVTPDGGTAWVAVARAFVREPAKAARAAANGRRALVALGGAAAALAASPPSR